MPTVLTSDFIPNCKEEIATPDVVRNHKHVARFAKYFNELDEHAEVLILVGRNCGEAMATRCNGYRAPFAQNTPLGWALVGITCLSSLRSSTATVLKSVTSSHTPEHVSARMMFSTVGSKFDSTDLFLQYPDDELPGPSKDDLHFMAKTIPNIVVNEQGCISMPLPFRDENMRFPDNRSPVFHRTRNTLNKLKLEPDKVTQCVRNMQKNILNGHVEEIPSSDLVATPGRCWYLPVFTVAHPKTGKLRIVFDSAAS